MLNGKIAIVTGSTSGIGHGIAEALAKAGVNVVLNGLGTEADNKDAIAAIAAHGTKVLFSPANMLKPDEIAGMVDMANKQLGSVDILINNAGIQFVAPVEEFPPFKSAYVTAKHGLAGLTKTVALEVATNKITCNCISPGYVWTPLVEKQIPDTMKARGMTKDQVINEVLLKAQPTKEFVTIDQVAALALFLCGDDAASITGANLSIDGGWTAE